MHNSVIEFAHQALTAEVIAGKTVLEVGSRIVNGSVRPFVTRLGPAAYTGVDIEEGPGVDEVVDAVDLTHHFGCTFDVVISTEMLEHAGDWRAAMYQMAASVAPGGLLLITTRAPGFHHHEPPDYWRYTVDDMALIVNILDLEQVDLAVDSEAPGVFLLARKRRGTWNPRPERLASIVLHEPDTSIRAPRTDPAAALAGQTRPGTVAAECQTVEVGGQKLVIAFPLYRQVPVSWFFQWLQMDTRRVAATVGTEAMYLPMAMHELINMAFEQCPDFDRLVVFEHDMIPPLDAFERIAQYRDEHDIVGTMYFKHDWPHHVMAWMQVQEPFYSPLTAEVTKLMVDNPALYEVDAVAMGLTAIRRQVFEKWDRDVPMWDPTPPLVGHDLHFCNEAKKQGFKVWVDSGIGSGHLTLVPIGYGHSQQALAVADPPRWTPEGEAPCELSLM